MNEELLMQVLAQVSAEFEKGNNNDPLQVSALKQKISTAVFQQQTPGSTSHDFLFQKMQSPITESLKNETLASLQNLYEAKEQDNPGIRIFRREVPFISSQVKSSAPDWARGASISETIGPLIGPHGRPVWFDIYKVEKGVKIYLQGAAQPAIILSLQVLRRLIFNHQTTKYSIAAGSVWINASLLAHTAPANQFISLKVKSGTISFAQSISLQNDTIQVLPGNKVTVDLILSQQIASGNAPGNIGIDAKNADIKLPENISFQFNHSGAQIMSAGNASWKLYEQNNSFQIQNGANPFYLSQFNRLLIPYIIDTPEFKIISASSVFSIRGKANVNQCAWSFSCASLDFNNPLEAAGSGAMMMKLKTGIEARWEGILDTNLTNEAWLNLRSPWVLAEPGRVSITNEDTSGNLAMQEYNLWQNKEEEWNKINLSYTDHFVFVYNCIQTGNEAIMSFTDCTAVIDKPVDVAAVPFELKSKQTLLILSFSKEKNSVALYDDNLLQDNAEPNNIQYQLKTRAIGLNNALLTVTPITGFILYAELKTYNSFEKAALLYSFGLLNYMPTLPDPYASSSANMRTTRDENVIGDTNNNLKNVNQLLLALMKWEKAEVPPVTFIWGDIAGGLQKQLTNEDAHKSPNPVAVPPVSRSRSKLNLAPTSRVSFSLNKNRELADENFSFYKERQEEELTEVYNIAGYNPEQTAMYVNNHERDPLERYQQRSAFQLLDVSTRADLLGVSLGYINERAIFEKRFQVEEVDDNANQLAIEGMDVVATSRFVRVFMLPQISWEPMINIPPLDEITTPNPQDPPFGILKFNNDGFPALIGNTGKAPVTLAPIPATKDLIKKYGSDKNYAAWSLFTLPNGMVSVGRYLQDNSYFNSPNKKGAKIELLKAAFANGTSAGWQIVTRAGPVPIEDNTIFEGQTIQLKNIHHISTNGAWSVLGKTPTEIFNGEFGNTIKTRGIPLERFDFTGYGAQVFSSWLNKNAMIAAVSQAIFDVWRGRVAKEIIQVRTILYPWAVRVVRTITMHRASTGFEFRVDSGWRADSDGVYNFATADEPQSELDFHPGLVKGVFNVKNIVENDLAPLNTSWHKTTGKYVNDDDGKIISVPPGGVNLDVEMVPVYFDADVFITDVEGTALDNNKVPKGRFVPSKKMIGYLQVAPRGVVISPELFVQVLNLQNGLGGPVDCTININGSKQMMRASHVEVNHSRNEVNKIVFTTAVKGLPVLPKEGSWSLAQHNKATDEVIPVTEKAIALIRRGLLQNGNVSDLSWPKEITAISELFKDPEQRNVQYAFLQNTDTQKILFRNPFFKMGESLLHSSMPDLGDAYKLMQSKGLFPNLSGLERLNFDAAGCATSIIAEGYKMVDKFATNTSKLFDSTFANKSYTFIDEPGILKVYVEYAPTGKVYEADPPGGKIKIDINSEVNNWVNKLNNVTMVVDLVGMERLFLITGQFDTAKGEKPEFKLPKLIPGEDLKPIIDILEILELIGTDPDYGKLIKKGLQIAMSNSPNNWEYKFQADKEIPVIQFPPAYLDGPTTPLRLKAGMKLGVYFNMGMELPPKTGLPSLSAGAFIEFDAELHVMCVSLAAATIYAVGQVTLRITGDTIKGPGLYLKLGFGVELMVGINVIGDVSVYYGVGIEMSADSNVIEVSAFIMFRGRAEIFAGLVTIQIQIEASGKVHRENNRTDCTAQVSFRLDVSIVFVINFHETLHWQETRQIA